MSIQDDLAFGSSPLARRTRGILVHAGGGARLIPARAGNTSMRLLIAASPTAHPRSRGEHFQKGGRSLVVVSGSSPLARGTRQMRSLPSPDVRLIPARAGNTCVLALRPSLPSAHPRSRGEHGTGEGTSPANFGSSPLARGTHAVFEVAVGVERLIPARAGNTRYCYG